MLVLEDGINRIYSPCIIDHLWCRPNCSAIVNGKWFDAKELRDFFKKEDMNIPFESRGFISNEEYSRRNVSYIVKQKGLKEIVKRGFWRIVNYF